VPKFRRATPANSEVISANLLHFKPIFNSLLKKVVSGPLSPVGGALVRLGHFLARVKIWGRSTAYGPKYVFPKNALRVCQHERL